MYDLGDAEGSGPVQDVTLLWALRSPCNLGCRYCYFGTLEDHRVAPPGQPGQLSHLSRDDLDLDEVSRFVGSLPGSAVRRVFLAGGEPLIWPPVLDVIEAIKEAGVQVVVCTNGLPLNRPEVTRRLVGLGVDAVSVSLDSSDAGTNDRYRPARNHLDGWPQVVSGIEALVAARASRPVPRVGLYMVMSRVTYPEVGRVAAFAAELGCDYFVPQPIALAGDHPLHGELALRPGDAPEIAAALGSVYRSRLPLALPDAKYPAQVTATVTAAEPGLVRDCFAGRTLHFIEPDGSVWDCPSSLRIAATPPVAHRTIRGQSAQTLFSADRTGGRNDCHLFSGDCVNMWPLMGFDAFLPVVT